MLKKILNLIPSTVIPIFIGAIITVINTNVLTNEQYGVLSLVNTTISIISIVFFSFFNQSFIREYKGGEDKKIINKYITFLNITFLILFLLSSPFIFVFGFKVILICFIAFFMNIYGIKITILRYNGEVSSYNIYRIMNSIMKLVLIIIIYNIYSNVINGYIIASLMSFIILVGKFYINNIKPQFDWELFKKALTFGIPLIGVNIGYLILSSFDKYMISFLKGNYELSYYAFSYQLSELSLLNINALLMVLFYPILIQVFDNEGKRAAENKLSYLFNYHLIIMIPVTLALIFLSEDIVHIFFHKYIGAELYVGLIAMGVFIYTTSYYTNKIFELTKKSNILFYITFLSAIINILLNLLFIPILGGIGATITTIISYIAYIVMSIKLGKKNFKFKVDVKLAINVVLINLVILYIISLLHLEITLFNLIFKSIIILCSNLILVFRLYKNGGVIY